MGRFVGGVFGNTIGSDTGITNTTGVFSMRDYYYIKQEGGLLPPPDGSTAGQAVDSVQDLLWHNASSGDKYVKLNGGSIVVLFYDSSARYGSINGWLRMTRTGMKLDGSKYGASFSNQGSACTSQWGNQSEARWQNGNETSATGNSDYGRFSFNLPNLQYCQIETLAGYGFGSQTPDDGGNSWAADATKSAALPQYVYGGSGTRIANPDGYFWAIWDGNNSGTFSTQTNSTGSIILPKPGGEGGSYSGTYNYSSLPLVSFNSTRTGCTMNTVSGDSGAEVIQWDEWTFWVH